MVFGVAFDTPRAFCTRRKYSTPVKLDCPFQTKQICMKPNTGLNLRYADTELCDMICFNFYWLPIILVILSMLGGINFLTAQVLYGTTYHGGDNFEYGTITKFTPATNNLVVAKSFGNFASNPLYTNFIEASDGKLYGMTSKGGSSGAGIIFSYNRTNSSYTKVKDLFIDFQKHLYEERVA